ncbi:aminodeoxychorismate lyase [candidate division KSB3 bacterium]|uniref:Endolytic murein transglycosylase n=1 Tax=candidate division KSB3 bacterium TaxID=2044937 RepID=A0A2G6E1T3_9BACT|nr:MAG: aminodeoxychorismate lyase [candidate division KSB3 bacterium]PIE28482.1 MAG: aminodeoxychorismate lyase [candidate division KSB3 bacterium]
MLKRIFITLLLLALLGMAGYVAWQVYQFLTVPPDNRAEERIVLIEPGTSLRRTAEILQAASVLRDKNLFMILAHFYRDGKSIKAGEYQFTTSMRPVEVLEKLQDGKVFVRSFTIPEGYTCRQIAEQLAEQGFGSKDRYLALAFDKNFAAELGIEAETLEGYLFPDTYHVVRGMDEKAVLQKMVQELLQKIVTADLRREMDARGRTLHETLTLASIIEKEARVAEERELISAVYTNRLRIGMKLDSDPTVIYGLKNFDGNLTKADLKKETPYNTYRRRGLPPGPIANPGKASILAALRPADVKYLYFVARNDGTHKFSTRYNEHLRAVREFQKKRK